MARGWSPERARAPRCSEPRFADRFSQLPELYRQRWGRGRLILPAVSSRLPRQGVQRPPWPLLPGACFQLPGRDVRPLFWLPLPAVSFPPLMPDVPPLSWRLLFPAVSSRLPRQGVQRPPWPLLPGACFQLPGRDVRPLFWLPLPAASFPPLMPDVPPLSWRPLLPAVSSRSPRQGVQRPSWPLLLGACFQLPGRDV